MNHIIIGNKNSKNIIILFPGRGGSASEICEKYAPYFKKYLIIGIESPTKAWYPAPNGPKDQDDAVNGLKKTLLKIEKYIDEVVGSIPREKVILGGFSAGGVVSLSLALRRKYLGAIIHSGCILNPDMFKIKCKETPIFVMHGYYDNVFSFKDRFSPTLEFLIKNNVPLKNITYPMGTHSLGIDEIERASVFAKELTKNSTR